MTRPELFLSHNSKADLLREACHRVVRNLSPTEWPRYFPSGQYEKVCPSLP
jgi:hypothetical protein